MRRWVGATAAAVAGALELTGCGVPAGGVIGVTVDATGAPQIVVQMCEGHIDGATLYLPDPDADRQPPQDRTMGRWEASGPVTGFSQFSLDSGGNGWAVSGELVGRAPGTRYTIYGWSRDSSWSAMHLEFSERDLKQLHPGTVLVPSKDLASEDNWTESVDDFKQKACDDWQF
ncbi:hypothetical protein [Kribbella sp. NPDC051137]|uniref:hypothetical protein n=1 Tax=Kribbella sp. NPDC051137 TaxID=3155045 RepID=UPI0034247887